MKYKRPLSITTIPSRHFRSALLALTLLATLFQLACSHASAASAQTATREVRALWVTRWDYKTPDDVKAIIRNSAAAGFNTLFFQVRGEATTFYPSALEPWAWELSGNISQTGRNPGWDPLALAITEAHARGLQLHAYMNVLTVWKQAELPPKSSNHLFLKHPDWIMVDAKGRAMSPARDKFYAFLNPARSDVRAYLAAVFADVARRYPTLDGIHFDYMRYPDETGSYSYDSVTLAEFRKISGGVPPAKAPKLWAKFQCSRIDNLVAQIVIAIRKANPKLVISAAVIANYESAVTEKGQRWLAWPDLGYIHAAVPMAYHYDMKEYSRYLTKCLEESRPKRGQIIIGIYPAEKWVAKEGYTPERMASQIALARAKGADGVALFSYSLFFPNHKPNRWAQYLQTHCFAKTQAPKPR